MNIGIVGSEGAKFTPETEQKARAIIRELIVPYDLVISGKCHLGGIDIWAVEEAEKLHKAFKEFPPAEKNWGAFKARNILIAKTSDVVYCITLKTLPEGYRGRGWEKYCYHCDTKEHVKSGGCWTVKYARGLGKQGHILVVE